MGMIVDVYRNGQTDCTRGGVSSKNKALCVVNVSGPFDPHEDLPAVILESHMRGAVRLVPAVKRGTADGGWRYERDERWAMMGGNYASTSDSRFVEKVEELLGHPFYGAVAIHDRYETNATGETR